ncbi:uncharacterized protein LOC132730092, partial [Ruditapes philippinarum]|uniref:uncharacterized protein LOC132730092 n=1 Tax=Ruditapes philippinarum TaxID=129788 RepID=UPI00295B3D4D
MAELSYIEMYIGRKVLEGNNVALKKYMHPDPVIDCKTNFVLLTDTDRKSIKGKDLTDKNDTILKKAISKGAKGYTDFKERLRKTRQRDLLELIVCAENGRDTKEIEDRLEKIAALRLGNLKHKCEELEMKESSNIDMHMGRQVINRKYDALKKYMHPDPVVDCKTDFVLLTDTDRKSIKSYNLTDKIDTILKKVISKGAKGYTDFKERLRKTRQTELLDLIVCAENGQQTKKTEDRLAGYIKHKLAVQSTVLEMDVWRKVFDQSTGKLKTYLIPDEIIHLDTGFELFSFTDIRDIKEETNTTKKNEVILTKVRSKGVFAYIHFKELLKITNQSKLADLLTYTERGLNTEEIEQQLDKMLEEQITRTVYDKQKRDETRQDIQNNGNIFQRFFERIRYHLMKT